MRRWQGLLALAGAALPGCESRGPVPPDAATVRIAIRADVTGFFPNPPVTNEGITIWTNREIFEGLTNLDADLRVVPGLADGSENPTPETYVFHLRPGTRFSDGRPLTAHDVAASLAAATSRDWINREDLLSIRSVRALDEGRVEVRTSHPHLALPRRLVRGFVLPRDALDRSPVPAVGSGPYRLESWQPGRGFVLVRNAYHHGPRPHFERAEFRVVPDAAERVALVQRGEVDVTESPPTERLPELEADPRLRVYAGPGTRVLFLRLDASKGPLADARVREALELALDREELVRRVYAGRARVAHQIAHPGVVGFIPNLPPPRTDRHAARRLLAEAGFAGGLAMRLDGTYDRYVQDGALLAEIARQFGEAGVAVEVAEASRIDFFRLLEARRSPFHLLGWGFETGDVGELLDQLLHSAQGGGLLGGPYALAIADPELDRLIDAANTSHSLKDRTEKLQAAVAHAGRTRCVIPLVIQPEAVVTSRRIAWRPPLNYFVRLTDLRPAP